MRSVALAMGLMVVALATSCVVEGPGLQYVYFRNDSAMTITLAEPSGSARPHVFFAVPPGTETRVPHDPGKCLPGLLVLEATAARTGAGKVLASLDRPKLCGWVHTAYDGYSLRVVARPSPSTSG